MKFRSRLLAGAAAVVAVAAVAFATGIKVGGPAPDFSLANAAGIPVKLSNYKGKYVVLEWVNPDCPFVKKHYDSGNMPNLQKGMTAQDVTWLMISSTTPSHGQYKSQAQMGAWLKEKGGAPTAVLLDPEGTVGRLYDARTTPHMFIINPSGALIYAGAIDSTRSANPADIKTSINYVEAALTEARAGKPVTHPVTTPYGCTVKYAN